MAPEQAATPAPAGFDISAFATAIAKANADAMAAALAPIHERLDKLGGAAGAQPAAAAAPAASPPAGGGLRLEDVAKLLDQRDQQRQTADRRAGFIGEKLKDLPTVYANQLGSDPAQWAAEEQRIRGAYREDLKRAGVVVPDVGGDGGAGAAAGSIVPPAGGVDYSKMSGTQLIELGLKQSRPQRG